MKHQMKSKTVLTAAMLLAAFLSSSMTASPVSADTVSAGKTIAAANGIILDSDSDAAELAVLNDLNGGVLPVLEFAENSTINHINGLISGRTVRNDRSAKAVIASVGSLLGIQDADSELQFMESDSDEYDTGYTFRQMYQGVPVEDAFVTVFADAETLKADYLNSSFVTDLSLNTTPAISAALVRDIVRAAYQSGLMKDPELMIIRDENGVRKLAYKATAYDLNVGAVYISAEDGRVLRGPAALFGNTFNVGYPDSSYKWEKNYANPVTGLKNFSILQRYVTVNGQDMLSLHDAHRSIYMINDEGNAATDALKELFQSANNNKKPDWTNPLHQRFLDKINMTKTTPDKINMSRYVMKHDIGKPCKNEDFVVGVMYQVERVYDYFCDTFNWRGTANLKKNNNDTNSTDRLFVIPFHGSPIESYSMATYNVIGFGAVTTDDPIYNHSAKEIAVVAHEYTHRILNNKLLWSQDTLGLNDDKCYGEAAALNEGYADIMGQYAELAIKGSINWQNGDVVRKSGVPFRDYTHAAKYTNQINGVTNRHYVKKSDYIDVKKSDYKVLEAHEGATILGHAAYRMNRYGIAPSDAQQIWFKSIDYLKDTDYTFADCRRAVIDAAKTVFDAEYNDALKRKEMMIKVHSAFNYAEIFPDTSYKMGDFDRNGTVNSLDVRKLRQYINNQFPCTDPEQISLGDVNYDGRINKEDIDKISRYLSSGESLYGTFPI